jgi:hypothetical protein
MRTELTIIILCIIGVIAGCSKLKIPVSDGRYIVYEKGLIKTSAEKVVLYYKDPNTTVLIVINDPNSQVNPGRIRIVEPRTGIAGEIIAE